MSTKVKATLAFENGMVFEGTSFGAQNIVCSGEVVFNTAMSGYQEIITDPSYKGQMVVMTAPQIGNTGINDFDHESSGIHLEGLIVKEASKISNHWLSKQSLEDFLVSANIPAIEGIDTRCITRMLRSEGSLRACLSTQTSDHETLIEKAKAAPSLEGRNLAQEVSCEKPYEFNDRRDPSPRGAAPTAQHDQKFHVVAVDLGIKTSILKQFARHGCRITVVPWNTPAKDILSFNPHGIFLSNGPGDPATVTETIETVKTLIGQKPIFGICLGHQILANALKGTTSKLKFGHHGANHPVLNQKTNKIEITSQNHSFVVDLMSLNGSNLEDIEITHVNLNDQTVEGFQSKKHKLLAIQYHPESSPGPRDSYTLFLDFIKMMEQNA